MISHYAESRIIFSFMLSVIVLSVVALVKLINYDATSSQVQKGLCDV